MKHHHLTKAAATIVAAALLFASCGSAERIGDNPARMLRTSSQVAQLRQLRRVTPDSLTSCGSHLYTLDYTDDYHLPDMVHADVRSLGGFVRQLGRRDLRLLPGLTHLRSVLPGCSCFAMQDSQQGGQIVGRNFDYLSPNGVSDIVLVRTAPANGYRSMGLVSLALLNHPPRSLSDGTTDLSLLYAAPYLVMDGINEKGFFIGVLYLDGDPTQQQYEGRHDIMTLTAIRQLLDHAATVRDAILILNAYNMFAGTTAGSYHFMVADTTGRHGVLEYIHDGDRHQWHLAPVEADYVTNFYLNDGWREIGHGYDRYDTLKTYFEQQGNTGTADDAMHLLQAVAQEPSTRKTSNTQWSAVYDLHQRSLRLCIGRDYNHVYNFTL